MLIASITVGAMPPPKIDSTTITTPQNSTVARDQNT